MAMVGDFVLGKTLEALCTGVEDLIRKNVMFQGLSMEIKSKLSSLEPLIQEMVQYNQKLTASGSHNELKDLEAVMKDGIELVDKCAEVSRWNPYKKFKYSKKLLQLDEALVKQLEILKVLGVRDGKKGIAMLGDIGKMVNHVDEAVSRLHLEKPSQSAERKAMCAVPDLPKLVVGLDAPLEELKAKLVEDDEVFMLVLTAPGGCGKTTLATKFCQDQQVKDKFKSNILFVTVSQKGTLELIVKQLYGSKGCSEVPDFTSEVHTLQWLQTFFKENTKNPLLLVLDDVWSGSESLLDNFQFERLNYKILVTSRSEFPRYGSSYHLQLLDHGNAMKLFRHSACLEDNSSPSLEELSKKIVKRCNGFPLAITVVGRSLCKQPIAIWKKRVTEWSRGSSILDSETRLLLCLQSSLDALNEEMKECFLDLGSFPEDLRIDVPTLIDMWSELYEGLDEDTLCYANLCELINRNLATLIDYRYAKMEGEEYYDEMRFTQHDLLRELAIYNAKEEPIEQRRRVLIDIIGNNIPKWWREQKDQPLKARLVSITTDENFTMEWPDMQLPEAEVLLLHFKTAESSSSSSSYALPTFVEKMNKLKVMVLCNYGSGDGRLSNFELLLSLPNLNRIRLQGIHFPNILNHPIQLKSVRKLSITACSFSLMHHPVIPVKISAMFPNLEEISLFSSYSVEEGEKIDVYDRIHLKKMSLVSSGVLVSPSIGNLVNLEVLRLRFLLDLKKLPDSIRNLKRLKFLDICQCYYLEELPEHIGEVSSLTKLDMRGCYDLRKLPLPQSISELNQLEEVICDDDTKRLWKPFLPTMKKFRVLCIARDGTCKELTGDESEGECEETSEEAEASDDDVEDDQEECDADK